MTALDGTTPQVVVGGIGVVVGTLGNRDVVGMSIGDLVGTALQIPLTNRGDNLKLGVEGLDGSLKTNLVVALAGAAMADGIGIFFLGNLSQCLCDARTSMRGAQQVLFVLGIGFQAGQM